MSKEKVVVFGGGGFLGSHVADALSDAGYDVHIFDILPSKTIREDQQMIVGDIMDIDAVKEAASNSMAIYNFAGLADIDEANDKPVETTQLNVMGNVNVLEAAREVGAKRFVYASTVYVYSDSGSFYRASKQSAERFVETYQDRYGLDYTILRYGSLYGPRADDRNGIYRMLKAALEKNAITYYGDGEALREYIHVTDAAELSVRILSDEYANRHLVLTGQERLKVKDLMKMISEMVPQKIDLEFSDVNPDSHYVVTPYAFHPRVGHKLTRNDYVDLGQGLLQCLAELHRSAHEEENGNGENFISLSGNRA